MAERVFRVWPEVKGQSSKRAEVSPGDDSKLTTPTYTVGNHNYILKEKRAQVSFFLNVCQ